jgi:hypothetical protein
LRFSLVVAADEEAEVEVDEEAAAAAVCVQVVGSRRRAACRAVPAWGLVRRHAQVRAAALGRAVDQWLAPGRAAVVRLLGPGREAVLRAQVRGPALLVGELRRAARALEAACQGKAPALDSDLAQADPVEILQAAVQRLVS